MLSRSDSCNPARSSSSRSSQSSAISRGTTLHREASVLSEVSSLDRPRPRQRQRERSDRQARLLQRLVGLRPTLSCSGSQILAKDAWVPCGDSQERDRWPLGRATTLLPVAKNVNANTHGASKACLRQADKPTERGDI